MPVHRLLTIPGYLVSALLVWISLPLLLALAALADLMLTRRFLAIRLVLILAVYLACEIAGAQPSLPERAAIDGALSRLAPAESC